MSDGSGGTPQLDERVEAHFDRQVAVGAEAHLRAEAERLRALIDPMKPQARAKYEPTVERLEKAADELQVALAASPGAGELDLTDDEIRALAESAERGADFLDIQGVHALTGVAKLRARLDRKDDDG